MGPERNAELRASGRDEKDAQELEALRLTSKRLIEEMQALALKAQKLTDEHAALAKTHAELVAESQRKRESRARANGTPAASLVKHALEVAEKRLGIQELSRRFSAPDATVRAWRDGLAAMPKPTFLLLVDVLTELDPTWKDWDEGRT